MIILGIDPGTATLGFALLEVSQQKIQTVLDYGVITTSKHLTDAERLLIIEQNLQSIIEKYQPNVFAIEKLFFFRNVTTVITVAQSRGVSLLVAKKNNLRILEFTPLQIKQAITGYGKAPKEQVQQMVKTILKLSTIPKPDDAADALAVGICAHQSLPMLDKLLS
jgi:crossover junction endodeoxyribonuclease RuvC